MSETLRASYQIGGDPTATVTIIGERVLLANCCDAEWTDLQGLAALRDWLTEQLAAGGFE